MRHKRNIVKRINILLTLLLAALTLAWFLFFFHPHLKTILSHKHLAAAYQTLAQKKHTLAQQVAAQREHNNNQDPIHNVHAQSFVLTRAKQHNIHVNSLNLNPAIPDDKKQALPPGVHCEHYALACSGAYENLSALIDDLSAYPLCTIRNISLSAGSCAKERSLTLQLTFFTLPEGVETPLQHDTPHIKSSSHCDPCIYKTSGNMLIDAYIKTPSGEPVHIQMNTDGTIKSLQRKPLKG